MWAAAAPFGEEEKAIDRFHARLAPAMDSPGLPWGAVYVNDGARDSGSAAPEGLRARRSEAAAVGLSRNRGKGTAATAGLDRAGGDTVVVVDADLQDPPGVVPELVAARGHHPGLAAALFLGGVRPVTPGVVPGGCLGRVFNGAKGRPPCLVERRRRPPGAIRRRRRDGAPDGGGAGRPGCPARRRGISRVAA